MTQKRAKTLVVVASLILFAGAGNILWAFTSLFITPIIEDGKSFPLELGPIHLSFFLGVFLINTAMEALGKQLNDTITYSLFTLGIGLVLWSLSITSPEVWKIQYSVAGLCAAVGGVIIWFKAKKGIKKDPVSV